MVWTIKSDEYQKMLDDCTSGFPLEACGIFLGPLSSEGLPFGVIEKVWPSTNIEKSARIYSLDPKDMFEATRYGLENELEIVGIYHSHTHTKAWPSPTDIEKVADPNWCYAIASLVSDTPTVNYFYISGGQVEQIDCQEV